MQDFIKHFYVGLWTYMAFLTISLSNMTSKEEKKKGGEEGGGNCSKDSRPGDEFEADVSKTAASVHAI